MCLFGYVYYSNGKNAHRNHRICPVEMLAQFCHPYSIQAPIFRHHCKCLIYNVHNHAIQHNVTTNRVLFKLFRDGVRNLALVSRVSDIIHITCTFKLIWHEFFFLLAVFRCVYPSSGLMDLTALTTLRLFSHFVLFSIYFGISPSTFTRWVIFYSHAHPWS